MSLLLLMESLIYPFAIISNLPKQIKFMKHSFIIVTAIITVAIYSCGNGSANTAANTTHASSNDSATTSADQNSSVTKNDETSSGAMIDTGKLQSDLNDMISAVTSGNPDTTKLKNAASDMMSTDAAMLSDSGIDKMYGNSNDPSVIAAKNTLKKMRDGMGITPDKLDSIKKAAATLKQNSSH